MKKVAALPCDPMPPAFCHWGCAASSETRAQEQKPRIISRFGLAGERLAAPRGKLSPFLACVPLLQSRFARLAKCHPIAAAYMSARPSIWGVFGSVFIRTCVGICINCTNWAKPPRFACPYKECLPTLIALITRHDIGGCWTRGGTMVRRATISPMFY